MKTSEKRKVILARSLTLSSDHEESGKGETLLKCCLDGSGGQVWILPSPLKIEEKFAVQGYKKGLNCMELGELEHFELVTNNYSLII